MKEHRAAPTHEPKKGPARCQPQRQGFACAVGPGDEKPHDAWLRAAIQQANAPRKSTKIGLSGAYDWSNPNIRDDVLILKVLERHKFEDVARLCFYYGVPKVKRVFKRQAFEPMTNVIVTRMLSNISKGLRAKP